MTFNGGCFDGGEGMRCRRRTAVHDAVGKSYDGVYVVGGGRRGEGSVRRAVDKDCLDCVGDAVCLVGRWSEHQRVLDVSD